MPRGTSLRAWQHQRALSSLKPLHTAAASVGGPVRTGPLANAQLHARPGPAVRPAPLHPPPPPPPQVFSSLAAARRLLEEERLRPFLLLHPNALPDFEGVPTGAAVTALQLLSLFLCLECPLQFRPALVMGRKLCCCVVLHWWTRLFEQADDTCTLREKNPESDGARACPAQRSPMLWWWAWPRRPSLTPT